MPWRQFLPNSHAGQVLSLTVAGLAISRQQTVGAAVPVLHALHTSSSSLRRTTSFFAIQKDYHCKVGWATLYFPVLEARQNIVIQSPFTCLRKLGESGTMLGSV